MTPQIMAGFWIFEEVEEVEDWSKAVAEVVVVDVDDADVEGEVLDDWSVVDVGDAVDVLVAN